MKKLGLTLAAFAFTASVFATGSSSENSKKWNGTIDSGSLKRYLQLDGYQHEEVSNICDHFAYEMKKANNAKENKEQKVRKAVYGNLKLMKKTLNEKQYTNYVRALSTTLRNRGISL